LGQSSSVLQELEGSKEPDLIAVGILAEYTYKNGAGKSTENVLERAKGLAQTQADNLNVQLCVGTVLADAGLNEEALALLAKHQGSLDAVALIVQVHLSMNRVDLAAKEALGARKWAQDSLLVNIAESWVGMREVCERLLSWSVV
jgi:coatomer protein complex subunit epsilon